jgi:hypothetical protein
MPTGVKAQTLKKRGGEWPGEVIYDRRVDFMGRNGVGFQTGVNIMSSFDDKIKLEPITSQGNIGNCRLEIPIEDIPAFIAEIKKLVVFKEA